jgi:hypothetical protein
MLSAPTSLASIMGIAPHHAAVTVLPCRGWDLAEEEVASIMGRGRSAPHRRHSLAMQGLGSR